MAARTQSEHTNKVRDQRQPKHFWADNEIVDVYLPMIGMAGFAVYMLLCRFANQEGQCDPSIAGLAKRLQVTQPTIRKAIKALEKANLITVKRGRSTTKGDPDTHLYTILAVKGRVLNPVEGVLNAVEEGVLNRVDQGTKPDLRGVLNHVSPNKTHLEQDSKNNTSLSPIAKASATDALAAEFDEKSVTSKELEAYLKVKQAAENLATPEPDTSIVKEELKSPNPYSAPPLPAEDITTSKNLDQFYILHKNTAIGGFKGFKTANDYKFARSLPGALTQGAGLPPGVTIEPPEDKRATPDALFTWVAVNIVKNDPQIAYDSKRIQKHIFLLMAPVINAEKRRLKLKVLPQADRDRVAGELDGWLAWYPTVCKGCSMPQDPTKFEMYVNQWYAAGKPGNKPAARTRHDPNCPKCGGKGFIRTRDAALDDYVTTVCDGGSVHV